MTDDKSGEIRSHFAAIVGARINRYETAELQLDDGTWDQWPDLPIRLYTDTGDVIAISWSGFDDLWIASDLSLPFSIDGSTTRWVSNSIDRINSAVGTSIQSVKLGQGELSIEGKEVEVWTRVLIELDRGWLEIFNALDENRYEFHAEKPSGNFVPCV